MNAYEARVRAEAALRMLAAGEIDQARILLRQAADWLAEEG